jgi:hypothetical protein
MRFCVLRLAAVALMGVLLVSCGGSDNTVASAPSDDWGLATVDLPDTVEEIAAAYDSMPAEVAGFRRVGGPSGEHLVDYGGEGANGPSLWNQGGDHRIVNGEGLSPAEFLAFMAGTGELDIIDSHLEGEVVWLQVATPVGDQSGEWAEYMLACGDADGEHLFFFNAFSPEDLDAVVKAFVQTLGE